MMVYFTNGLFSPPYREIFEKIIDIQPSLHYTVPEYVKPVYLSLAPGNYFSNTDVMKKRKKA
jgi:hypothetical protein